MVGVFILARFPLEDTGGCSIATALEANPAQDIFTFARETFLQSPIDMKMTQMIEEADIFIMLMSLVCPESSLDMSGMWMPGVPKMKLRVYQFDRLFKKNLPRLHSHFDELKLAPEVLVAQWIITLFSYTVPLPITMGLWDYIMTGGWSAVYRIALTILNFKEDELLIMDLDEVGKTMREWKGNQGAGSAASSSATSLISLEEWKTFLNEANSLLVTSEVLLQLHENYGLELIYSAENQDPQVIKDKDTKYNSTNPNECGHETPPAVKRESSTNSVCSTASKARDLEPAQTGWFDRYGENLSPIAQNDMAFLAEELRTLDIQVEKDKVCLQKKILETCDMIKIADERARKAIRKQGGLKLEVGELERSLEETVFRSEKIAYYVGVLMNSTSNMSPHFSLGSDVVPTRDISDTSDQTLSREGSSSSEFSDITAVSELDSEKCRLYIEHLESEFLSKDENSSGKLALGSSSENSSICVRDDCLQETKIAQGFDDGRTVSDNANSASTSEIIAVSTVSLKSGKRKGKASGLGSFIRGIAKHFGRSGPVASSKPTCADMISESTISQGPGRSLVNVGDEKEKQNALLARINFFSLESSKCQNDIIEITRRLTDLRESLSRVDKFMHSAVIAAEDALIRKKSLCEQLQLLSQTANGERSRKLQIAADMYGT